MSFHTAAPSIVPQEQEPSTQPDQATNMEHEIYNQDQE